MKIVIRSKKQMAVEKEAVYTEGLYNGAATAVGMFGAAATVVGFTGLATNLIDRKSHEKVSSKVNAEVAALRQTSTVN